MLKLLMIQLFSMTVMVRQPQILKLQYGSCIYAAGGGGVDNDDNTQDEEDDDDDINVLFHFYFRHLVHASVKYDGIPGASFPGLEDAIYLVRTQDSAENTRQLQKHFTVLVHTIQEAANSLKDTTAFLRSSH